MTFLTAFFIVFCVQAVICCALNIYLNVRVPGTFLDLCMRLTLPGIIRLEIAMGRCKISPLVEKFMYALFAYIYISSVVALWWTA